MYRRSERVQRLCNLAELEERSEGQEMGRAQRLLDAEVLRLEELEAYRQSYQKKRGLCTGINPAHWRDYQDFLNRLDQALAAQADNVLSGKENRDAHRRRWIGKRQKVDSLQRAIERYQQSEHDEADKLLQKTLDDLPVMNAFFEPAK